METFIGIITDVAESLARTGFKRLLVVNGHGGTDGPLMAASTGLVARGIAVGFVVYFKPGEKAWMEHLSDELRGVAHGCAFETSLQMALRPDEADRIASKVRSLPPRMSPCYLVGNAPDPIKPAGAYWGPSSSQAIRAMSAIAQRHPARPARPC